MPINARRPPTSSARASWTGSARLTVEGDFEPDFLVRARLVGAEYGTQQSVIDEIVDDSVTMPVVLLHQQDTLLGQAAIDAVNDAEDARQRARRPGRRSGQDDRRRARARPQQRRDPGFATLDGPFRDWLADLDITEPPPRPAGGLAGPGTGDHRAAGRPGARRRPATPPGKAASSRPARARTCGCPPRAPTRSSDHGSARRCPAPIPRPASRRSSDQGIPGGQHMTATLPDERQYTSRPGRPGRRRVRPRTAGRLPSRHQHRRRAVWLSCAAAPANSPRRAGAVGADRSRTALPGPDAHRSPSARAEDRVLPGRDPVRAAPAVPPQPGDALPRRRAGGRRAPADAAGQDR